MKKMLTGLFERKTMIMMKDSFTHQANTGCKVKLLFETVVQVLCDRRLGS